MPTDDELREAIMNATDTPEAFVQAVHAFYRSADRADSVSRELLYLHLGMSIGMITRLLATARGAIVT